jgi:D-serine deaminase-like pyridoxal phosphate-dependent protein
MTETPETTLASRWLCNPIFASHAFWRKGAAQIVREHASHSDPSVRTDVVSALAERLEQGIARQADRLLQGLGLYQALVDSALERIDWSSVAEALLKQSNQRQGWQAVDALLVTTGGTKSLTRAHTLRSRELVRR